MTPEQVDEAMRLASRYAMRRAQRAKEMAKPVGLRMEPESTLNERVHKAELALRTFLNQFINS